MTLSGICMQGSIYMPARYSIGDLVKAHVSFWKRGDVSNDFNSAWVELDIVGIITQVYTYGSFSRRRNSYKIEPSNGDGPYQATAVNIKLIRHGKSSEILTIKYANE
jgi:hypothetical protein